MTASYVVVAQIKDKDTAVWPFWMAVNYLCAQLYDMYTRNNNNLL